MKHGTLMLSTQGFGWSYCKMNGCWFVRLGWLAAAYIPEGMDNILRVYVDAIEFSQQLAQITNEQREDVG